MVPNASAVPIGRAACLAGRDYLEGVRTTIEKEKREEVRLVCRGGEGGGGRGRGEIRWAYGRQKGECGALHRNQKECVYR